jgi:hypothetical protein
VCLLAEGLCESFDRDRKDEAVLHNTVVVICEGISEEFVHAACDRDRQWPIVCRLLSANFRHSSALRVSFSKHLRLEIFSVARVTFSQLGGQASGVETTSDI